MSLNMNDLTYDLKVIRKKQETEDAVSFSLEIPKTLEEKFAYKPGQFVTFALNVGGENINRSYSLCTSPYVDSEFKVTVKRVKGGRGSNFLIDQVHEGDLLKTTPPAGIFFKPTSEDSHFYLFAAGSGITPIFSILKSVLHQNSNNKVTLLFCNRDESHIIYHDELPKLQETYGDRLTIHIALSKPTGQWSGFSSRVNNDILGEVVPSNPTMQTEAYMCGPDGFMQTVHEFLTAERAWNSDRIHRESFTTNSTSPSTSTSTSSEEGVWIGDESQKSPAQTLKVTCNGEQHEISVKNDDSILEQLLEAGINAPYSCMDGACMACMGKVQQGLVLQDDYGVLNEDNIEDRECLTCQAKARSTIVHIDFDEL
jgi:ring-1,2-phenylacetyl-CoA epoxidase subunit PaaE